MNNALLYIAGFCAAVLAALFAIPYFVDWNSYRGVFEEEATRVLGRNVRVGGSVNLRLLPAPYVRFEKLRIADAGNGGESFFRADSFTMWLSLPPLLKGVLEANKIELDKPTLRLATDQSGGGNWQSLSITPGALPFVPTGIALQSVTLVDGSISFSAAHREEILRLDSINGELSAEALDGPYKFSGTLDWHGNRKEVRFATGKQSADGDVRLKVNVRSLDSASHYLVSGVIRDLEKKPSFEGDVSAKVVVVTRPASKPDKASQPQPVAAEPPEPDDGRSLLPARAATKGARFDLAGKLKGTIDGVDLDDITMTLEQEGPPQIVTGKAHVEWPERTRLELSLGSHWLDLDRIAGQEGDSTPLTAVRDGIGALIRVLPAEADTNAALTFEQVTLGGEALSDVRLAVRRSTGPLELKDMRASLPGGTRLEINGIVSGDEAARGLDGTVSLRGTSLNRFLGWAGRGLPNAEHRGDGPFALEGELKLAGDAVELKKAQLELGGSQMHGSVRVGLGERRQLAADLEGDRIDVGHLWPGLLEPTRLVELLGIPERVAAIAIGAPAAAETATPDRDAAPAKEDATAKAPSADLRVRVRAAELTDGIRTFRDVDADVSLENGKLSMPVLKLATTDGLRVDLEADASNVLTAAEGTVRGVVEAPRQEAARQLAQLLPLESVRPAVEARLPLLAPVRLAVSLTAGGSGGATELRFDGSSARGRLTGGLRAEAGLSKFRSAPAHFSMTVEGPDIARSAGVVLGQSEAPVLQRLADAGAGRLDVRAAGTGEKGYLTSATLDAQRIKAGFEGRIVTPADDAASLTGDVSVKSDDTSLALALAGIRVAGGAAAVPIEGSLRLTAGSGTAELGDLSIIAGDVKLNGVLTLGGTGGKLETIAAKLSADHATIPGLLGLIVSQPQVASAAPPPTASPPETARGRKQPQQEQAAAPVEPPLWPDQPFDMSQLESVNGTLEVRFASLGLDQGLAMSDTLLVATLTPGQITVDRLEGKALGGALASRLQFEKAAAGIAMSGNLSLDIGPGSQPAEADAGKKTAAMKLDFSGRALTPAGLITGLAGKGEIALSDIELTGNSPAAVASVVEAALRGTVPMTSEPLTNALKAALKEGKLPLGSTTIPIEIKDGGLRLAKIERETPDGRSTLQTVIELQSLSIDSEFRISPRIARTATGGDKGEKLLLPPVSVVYTGKLKDLATLEPTVETAELERELTVRKMERDVAELERLRKLDQEQARAEEARQKAMEAEKAKAAAAAKAAAEAASGAAGPPPADATSPEAPPSTAPAAPGADPAEGATATPDATAATGTVATASDPKAQPVDPDAARKTNRAPTVVRKKRPSVDQPNPWQLTPYQ